RRLARRWQLPRWLTAVTGHLGLPAETAHLLGADIDLFHVVQLAVALAQQQGIGLYLSSGTSAEMGSALGMSAEDLQAARHQAQALVEQASSESGHLGESKFQAPGTLPLLPDLLRLAVENRRLLGVHLVEDLASDLDQLHQALEEQRSS